MNSQKPDTSHITPDNAEELPPQQRDEQSISGHMPSPKSDNDVNEVTNQMGIYTQDNTQEVNIAKQLMDAERARRKQPPK